MKGVQNEYHKRTRMSTNRDIFTTYQRSPALREKQKIDSQHHEIESLKNTLNSMKQASIDLSKTITEEHSLTTHQQSEHRQYNLKLDQLCRNLQELADKDYFSPANAANIPKNIRPRSSTYNYQQLNHLSHQNLDFSQKVAFYEPMKTEQVPRSNYAQLGPTKSQSFHKKEESQSKKNSQNRSTYQHKASQDLLWTGKAEFKNNNTKKTFSKREIISQSVSNQNSKNLSKIFEKLEETSEMPRMRERADTQFKQNTTIFNKCIHRGKITSILISDHIYTTSLDYHIRKTSEKQGEFTSEIVDKFRGGVQHAAQINGKIFGVGRDCFMRSIDGNFHHKFDSCPVKIYESDRINQVTLKFVSGQVQLFDIEKRTAVLDFVAERESELMSKWNKELFLGNDRCLLAIDWRKRQQVTLCQFNEFSAKKWMSMQFDRHFGYHSNGELAVLNQKLTKNYTYRLPEGQSFRNYDWNRSGLNVLTVMQGMNTAKLTRIKSEKQRQREEIDLQTSGQNLSHVVLGEKQIIYAGNRGQLIIKKLKK